MMEKLAPVLVMISLVGCAAPIVCIRPGTPPEVRDADLAKCQLTAELAQPDIPVDLATDFDAALRRIKVQNLCMKSMGYTPTKAQ
jgi:hypothetical protein